MRRWMVVVLAITGLWSLACAGGSKIEVVNKGADDACSSLLDYCIRVKCSVKNTGTAEGDANVTLSVYLPDGGTVEHNELVRLDAGELKQVQHDFPEAKLLDSGIKYRCTVD